MVLCGFSCDDSGTQSVSVFLLHRGLGHHCPIELSAMMDPFYNDSGHYFCGF